MTVPFEFPLVHIAGVRADPEAARGWYHGIRIPGTNVPGVITAGTFYQDGKRVFWDVHSPEKTIVIGSKPRGKITIQSIFHALEECGKSPEAARLDSAPSACVSAWECMGDKRSTVPISGCSNIP